MSDDEYPTARRPFGTFNRWMIGGMRSARIRPASSERRRRVEDHRLAVRDERMIRHVSRRAVVPHVAGDRIGHRVRKMHAPLDAATGAG